MSFRNNSGTLFNKTSLITPPAEPVIVPKTIQTQNGNPASMLLLMPTTVNKPSPIASKRNKVLPHLDILCGKNTLVNKATPVVRKYLLSNIQNGVTSSNKSRMVPPPM